MGGKFSVFMNKSNVEMELRVFLPPSRPDKYRKIIRIKPGEWKLLNLTELCSGSLGVAHPIHVMVFIDGVYMATFYPCHIKKYAKILGYVNSNGLFKLKGTIFCRQSGKPRRMCILSTESLVELEERSLQNLVCFDSSLMEQFGNCMHL